MEPGELWEITLRSLFVAGLATLLAGGLGVPLGLFLALKAPGRLPRILLYTGMGLPSVVVGLFFYLLLSRQGPLGSLGLLYTPWAMVLAQTVLALSLVASFLYTGARSRAEEVRTLVKSLGGREAQIPLTLLWESRRALAAGLASGFGDIRHQTRVLTTAIVLETRKGELEAALALGAVLLGVSLLVVALLLILEENA